MWFFTKRFGKQHGPALKPGENVRAQDAEDSPQDALARTYDQINQEIQAGAVPDVGIMLTAEPQETRDRWGKGSERNTLTISVAHETLKNFVDPCLPESWCTLESRAVLCEIVANAIVDRWMEVFVPRFVYLYPWLSPEYWDACAELRQMLGEHARHYVYATFPSLLSGSLQPESSECAGADSSSLT